jgi:diaminopimelate decarboxylase
MLLGTQRVNEFGNLEIGGCDVTRLAEEFGTPLYVMDEQLVRENCRAYRTAFEKRYPKNTICFASKAFISTAICRIVEDEGLNLDVASLGELHVALKAKFPRKRINLHGNNKSREELEYAVKSRIGHVVVDNFQEIELLAAVCREMNAKMDVLVRCTPGVDPHTHKFISTGQADTKFGLNIKDGSALTAIRRILELPALRFDGIHCHVGSQLLDTEAHEGAVDAFVGLMTEIHAETGVHCKVLNIGGGLGVRYRGEHEPPSYDEFAEIITSRLKAGLDAAGLPYPVLQQEPGRSLVGEAGVTVYTVGTIKTVPIQEEPGTRTYVAVDGGLSDNPRPQLYDAVYELIVANRAAEPHDQTITLAGKHCETDVLIWNVKSAKVEPGDIIAVQTTGAYNHVMASNYNKFLRPAVVLVCDGQADVIVERETLADIVRRERIPSRLQKGAARSLALVGRLAKSAPRE